MTDDCSIIRFPEQWGIKREPRRPVELRKDYFNGMKFNDNFDWDNIWYDVVQVTPDTVLLIGPPLYQTANFIARNCQITANNTTPLSGRFVEMDRACVTVINTPDWVESLSMHSSVITPIKVNRISNEFDNLNVVFTLQKDNPISWIQEWIAYNHLSLGINGILIYDNGSSNYTVEQLEAAIQTHGVTVKVVKWDIPYGPQGFDCNHYNTWDSDYAQSTMFEHAKRRYLTNARIAINADIDELVVFKNRDIDGVIKDLETNGLNGYCYKGNWIEPFDISSNKAAIEIPIEERHFWDYHCVDIKHPRELGNKWLLIPNKSLDSQWCVHHTGAKMQQTTDIYYGHYLAMNTNWSWPRDAFDRDTSGLVPDQLLLNNLSKIRKN